MNAPYSAKQWNLIERGKQSWRVFRNVWHNGDPLSASSTQAVTFSVSSLFGAQTATGLQQLQAQVGYCQQQTATTMNWHSALAGVIGQGQVQGFGSYCQYVLNNNVIYYDWQDCKETAEQVAERLKLEAKRQAAREAASKRAEKLLFTILTPTQVKQYTDDDFVEMAVKRRIYRIRKGYSMNVELIEAGKPKIKYCAHPTDAYNTPVPDVMLSQLLMLKANEGEFLRIANRTIM